MPTVSLCMIVNNEEDFLHQCLMNVSNCVDEIIVVVNKGKTSKVAENFGAKIIEHEWNDDFSDARNESLKYATKEWILVIDSDEVLVQDDLLELKKMADEDDAIAFMLHQINYTNDTNQFRFIKSSNLFTKKFNFDGYFDVPTIRFFKNNMGFHFRRRVHEIVDESIIENGLESSIKDSGIALHHLKMIKDNLIESEKRYMILSEKEVAENPSNYKALFDIGLISTCTTSDYEKAESSLKKCLDINKNFNEARIALAYLYFHMKKYSESLEKFEESLKYDKNNPFIYSNIGSCLVMLKKHKEAIEIYKKAIEMGHPEKDILMEKIRNIEMLL